MKNIILILLLFTVSFSSVYSQDSEVFKPDSIKKILGAAEIHSYIRIDGVLDEDEWKIATVSPPFTQIEPVQGILSGFETSVKILYNRHFLYIGVFAKDSLGKKAIRATDFKRDFDFQKHDLVVFSFDGFRDERNGMHFATNAFGVQADFLSFDDMYFDDDWDAVWKVRTNRTDTGWYSEIAIPWHSLRYSRKNDSVQQWGFNIYRNRRLTNEGSAFSPYPRSFGFTRMNYEGLLTNLKPPPPRANIRLQPFMLTSLNQSSTGDGSFKRKETTFKPGGDIKWAISPNTVLDLTFNTDFAQADADRQVNNITRFSVFFPERRQFFLENASLFAVGISPFDDFSGGNMRIQPFFSRRVGLDDQGKSIPIDAGSRLVYRSAKRNYGAMLIRQREQNGTPATNFFVTRYSENLGSQNRVGALVTVRNRPDYSNIVSAVDGFFRVKEEHSVNAMAIHSVSTNNKQNGFAGFAQYFYSNNQWKFWWTQSVVTKHFNPELGFVSRNDVIGTTPGLYWFYRGKMLPFKKIVRAFEPGLLTEFYHQSSTGKLIERQISINPIWFNLQNGGFFGYVFTPSYQLLNEAFYPADSVRIEVGEYRYSRHYANMGTDPSRKLSAQLTLETGTYYDGKLHRGDFTLRFAPIPHISVTTRFNRNHFRNVGTIDQDAKVDLYSIEGRFALNPRVQLTGFYQRNSENKRTNMNIRFSWEYQPLSFIYIVYNLRGFDNAEFKRETEAQSIAKISYLKQL
jgi:hypothetical protein